MALFLGWRHWLAAGLIVLAMAAGALADCLTVDPTLLTAAVFDLAPAKDDGTVATAADKVLRQPGTKERVTLPAGSPLSGPAVMTVRSAGATVTVATWTATAQVELPSDTVTIVAVFPERGDKPTDVACVQTDRFCSVGGEPLLPMGPDDAFTIVNSHFNSNQGYRDIGLFHVIEGRLRRVASVFLLDVRTDDCAHSFTESLAWRVAKAEPGRYPDVTAEVGRAPGTDCGQTAKKLPAKRFVETYRFDAAKKKYQPLGHGFDALDAFNRDNM